MLHYIINPDLKTAHNILRYLKNPTNMTHINSSRFSSFTVLIFKIAVGYIAETIFILSVSKIKENDN
jgi:hypothetical protein